MALLLFGFRFFGFLHVVCKPVQYLNSMGIPLHGCTGSIWTWQIEGCKQYFNRYATHRSGIACMDACGGRERISVDFFFTVLFRWCAICWINTAVFYFPFCFTYQQVRTIFFPGICLSLEVESFYFLVFRAEHKEFPTPQWLWTHSMWKEVWLNLYHQQTPTYTHK